jgi:hypothetical protein
VVLAFFRVLYSLRRRKGREDFIWWIRSRRKKFEVRSFFKGVYNLWGYYFSWMSILKVKKHLRVSFFVWTTALGKLLTLDNLRKGRGAENL